MSASDSAVAKARLDDLGQRILLCQVKHAEAMRSYFAKKVREQIEATGAGRMVFQFQYGNGPVRVHQWRSA